MKRRMYNVGIDVGLNSVGFAAIEVDESGMPIRILNAQSVIHDGGVDPNPTQRKSATSRRSVAGVARRTRRMRRRRRERLKKLDDLLLEYGFPVEERTEGQSYESWYVRAELADGVIEDEDRRRRMIAMACRHIARHRGWRNPYNRVESLLNVEKPHSEQFEQLREQAIERIGGTYISRGYDQRSDCQVCVGI